MEFYNRIRRSNRCRTYDKLKVLVSKTFKEADNVYISYKYRNLDTNKIKDYYKYFLNNYKKSYKSLMDNNIYLNDNKIIIEAPNKAEKKKLDDILNDLTYNFKLSGFNYKVEILLSEEQQNKIKEEIEKEIQNGIKREIITKEDPIIYGTESKKIKITILKILFLKTIM